MNKILSYTAALCLGLLAVAPHINYDIPLMVNSFGWLYLVVVSVLLGFFLLSKDMPLSFKILTVYLWLTCFISSVPYLSFNAYILVVLSLYFFLIFKICDQKIILNMVQAVFWVQVCFGVMQLCGVDTLMNFDRPEPVFLGTVMQYMRFSSHLAILAPLLIYKNKWYIIPIAILAIVSQSSSFGFAVICGATVYVFLKYPKWRLRTIGLALVAGGGYFIWDNGSFQTAFSCGRLPAWGDIIKTWCFDTSQVSIPVSENYMHGPIAWKSILFGRGMDTFLPLFPIFKHDPNPFPQAHNCWLQYLWEIGLIGTSVILTYCVNLVRRLAKHKEYLLIAGAVCISINMFFAFPTRLTQNMLLIICFLAFCEKKARAV